MKIIAFYLPQFHEIPENDEWWGKGFTEWVNVKKAKKYVDNQNQPRIPLNNNYYNLLDINVMKWQVSLAKKYGIYGFCMYHYWFNGHKLLEKPIENYLLHSELDLPFCLCWANENWTNQWIAGKKQKVLIEQTYGDKKEWIEHFEYMLPFFKDKRYITCEGKPFLVIYRPELIDNLDEMLIKWDYLAKKNGLNGISYAYQKANSDQFNYKNGRNHLFNYQIEYQPLSCIEWQRSNFKAMVINTKRRIFLTLGKIFKTQKLSTIIFNQKLQRRNYDDDWKCILSHIPESSKCIPGAFTDWDNTPRKQMRGFYYENVSVKKFEIYMKKLIQRVKEVYEKDMIFIFAWNEWAEGGYLEPDENNRYGYLEAIYNALKDSNELPE